MKAIFKDTDKLIISSLDHSEAIVGKAFLKNLEEDGKTLKVEQRNEPYQDEFDGLVITIVDKETDIEQG